MPYKKMPTLSLQHHSNARKQDVVRLLIVLMLSLCGCQRTGQLVVDIESHFVSHRENFTQLVRAVENSEFDSIFHGGLSGAVEVLGPSGTVDYIQSRDGRELRSLLELSGASGCFKSAVGVVCQMPAREKLGMTHLFNIIRSSNIGSIGDTCSRKDMTSDGKCTIDMDDGWWIEYEAYTDRPVEEGVSIVN